MYVGIKILRKKCFVNQDYYQFNVTHIYYDFYDNKCFSCFEAMNQLGVTLQTKGHGILLVCTKPCSVFPLSCKSVGTRGREMNI